MGIPELKMIRSTWSGMDSSTSETNETRIARNTTRVLLELLGILLGILLDLLGFTGI